MGGKAMCLGGRFVVEMRVRIARFEEIVRTSHFSSADLGVVLAYSMRVGSMVPPVPPVLKDHV
jgi:hypothetical protein